MTFLRPAAQATLRKYRDFILAAALAALGLYWALTQFGLMVWIGWITVAGALGLAISTWQRFRFRTGQGGVGVVSVKEGQITYLAPFDGGMVALSELSTLVLDYRQDPPRWVLKQTGQHDVHIPLNAEGSDRLFDVFAALPGLQTGHMLAALEKNEGHPIVIWQRPSSAQNLRRLH